MIVAPPKVKVAKTKPNAVSQRTQQWLSVSYFRTAAECIAQLRRENRQIWISHVDSSAKALALSASSTATPAIHLPSKFAVVMGSERDGVSSQFLDVADQTFYFPMHGFVESFNVSVCAALIVQRLFDIEPAMRGQIVDPSLRTEVLKRWCVVLGRGDFDAQFVQDQIEEHDNKQKP
jgi:tRNA (guanosine-2'-O-)-methyltransferase